MVRKLVDDLDEAFDALLSVEFEAQDVRMNRALRHLKDYLLHRVKAWRDFFLHTSDWTQLLDAPVTDAEREDWKRYRQLCRELPDQFETGTQVLLKSRFLLILLFSRRTIYL